MQSTWVTLYKIVFKMMHWILTCRIFCERDSMSLLFMFLFGNHVHCMAGCMLHASHGRVRSAGTGTKLAGPFCTTTTTSTFSCSDLLVFHLHISPVVDVPQWGGIRYFVPVLTSKNDVFLVEISYNIFSTYRLPLNLCLFSPCFDKCTVRAR